jgi:hypothetical protein
VAKTRRTDNTRNERQRRWYWRNRELKNAINRERYYGFKSAGLCPCCGSQPEPDRVLCRVCQNKRNGIAKMMAETSLPR